MNLYFLSIWFNYMFYLRVFAHLFPPFVLYNFSNSLKYSKSGSILKFALVHQSLDKTSHSLQSSWFFLVITSSPFTTPPCPLLCQLPIGHLLPFLCCILSYTLSCHECHWHPLLLLIKLLNSISDWTRCISCLSSYGKMLVIINSWPKGRYVIEASN